MSKVTQHFISRFKNGVLLSADYSQIEVICFAHLCKDQTLQGLLRAGQDVHLYLGSEIYNKPQEEVTKEERSGIKPCTFGIIYGNGAKKLSENTGQTEQWCKDFIQTFYELFPNAKAWHEYLKNEVEKKGEIRNFTGRILKFKKHPAKYDWQHKKGITESYNPPDYKNWPVQSLAYDIVSLMIGEFFREAINHRDKFLLINTIHDSLMVDCKKEYKDFTVKIIKEKLENVQSMVYNRWSERINLPFKVKISEGTTWYDLKEVEDV